MDGAWPPGGAERFERVLRHFTARHGVRFDVLEPAPAYSPAILPRKIRYVHRNPVLERLVDDPWTWPWSTLRDLGGAGADPGFLSRIGTSWYTLVIECRVTGTTGMRCDAWPP